MNKIIDFKKITIERNVKKELSEDREISLVIYSPTSVAKNNIKLNNDNYIYYSTNEVTKEKTKIDALFKDLNNVEKIITIGGGTATDIGKYLASKFNKKVISVPTMLSTNAFATNKVALVVDNKIVSLDAITPTEIYLDKNLLLSSTENNLYGLIDIFSIYTALNDWKLAIEYNNEVKSDEYNMAQSLLEKTINYVSSHSNNEIGEDVESIYYMIGESGLITNLYGSGKPESGSEHIFAKALEKEVNIPHAVSVTNGLVLMIIAQSIIINNGKLNKQDKLMMDLLKKLNMFNLNIKYKISKSLIDQVFTNLKPRSDRYTVVNLIYENDAIKKKVLAEYQMIMKGSLK